MSLSPDYSSSLNLQDLTIFTDFGCLLGAIGALFIIITYISIEKLRSQYIYRNLIHLAFMDLLCVASKPIAMMLTNTGITCQLMIYIETYSLVGTFIWTLVITWNLHNLIVYQLVPTLKVITRWKYIVIGYTLPLVFVYLRWRSWTYSISEITCQELLILKAYTLTYGESSTPLYLYPFYVTLFGEILLYIRIYLHLRGQLVSGEARAVYFQLVWYPLVLIVCWGPGLLYDILLKNGIEHFQLLYLFFCISSGQGFYNALVYGWTYNVKVILKDSCCKRFRKTRSLPSSTSSVMYVQL